MRNLPVVIQGFEARILIIPIPITQIHHRQHPGKLVYLRGWNTGQGILDLGKPRRMYEEWQASNYNYFIEMTRMKIIIMTTMIRIMILTFDDDDHNYWKAAMIVRQAVCWFTKL